MAGERRLQVEGELRVTETTGTWGVYAGERIIVGSTNSFRNDLGVRIKEMFDEESRKAIASGTPPPETFSVPRRSHHDRGPRSTRLPAVRVARGEQGARPPVPHGRCAAGCQNSQRRGTCGEAAAQAGHDRRGPRPARGRAH